MGNRNKIENNYIWFFRIRDQRTASNEIRAIGKGLKELTSLTQLTLHLDFYRWYN